MIAELVRVMVVEDNLGDARLIRELLGGSVGGRFEVHETQRLNQTLDSIASSACEAILLDLGLPDSSGLDTFRAIHSGSPKMPIVIFSGARDDELAADAVSEGAQDFLVKGEVESFYLKRAIRHAIERKRVEERLSQTERQLRMSEARFKQIFESSLLGMFFWSIDGAIVDANQAFLRFGGYDRQDLAAGLISWKDSTPPEYAHLDARALEELAVNRSCAPFEKEWIRKDGARLPVIVGGAMLGDGDDGGVAFLLDISDRKSSERALKARQRQQEAVALFGQQAIDVTDLDVLFHQAVTAASTTLDAAYAAVTEIGTNGDTLVLRAGIGWRDGYEGRRSPIAGTPSSYTIEHNIPSASDDLRSETRFHPNAFQRDHDVAGAVTVAIPTRTKPFGTLGVYAKEPRKFTADDINFLQSIAHIVGTAIDRDRGDASLRQTQKLESVGRLAGGVAHDFNNLLTVINGEAEIALADMPPKHQFRGAMEEIMRAGESAAGLTRQLLTFSSQQVVEPTVFNPNDLVVEVQRLLRRTLGEDLQLVLRLEPNLGSIRMDRGQLEQVLVNLAVNARDAMKTGGVLTVETSNVTLEDESAHEGVGGLSGEYVCLAVSDTGSGMSDDVKARVFEPFFTTKAMGHGTGLGLATCYGIVTQAHGRIVIYSELGLGTTMKCFLPLAPESPTREMARVTAAHLGNSEAILLVEDESGVRHIAARMLEKQGFRVRSVSSGEEALQVLADTERIDLLLTDMVLPGMNGRMIAEKAKELRPGIRVLFASGYSKDVAILNGVSDESFVMVTKPYTSDSLGRKVRQVLDAAD